MQTYYSLRLAHINDCHSNFDPVALSLNLALGNETHRVACHSGGYGRVASVLEAERQQAKADDTPFLFLHGGDTFQGTLYFRHFKGEANARMLNLLRPDAMVLGNHDIDSGNEPLHHFVNAIDFPLLAGNMDLSQETPGKAHPLGQLENLLAFDSERGIANVMYHELKDKKLAIFGITLEQMPIIARPDPDTQFLNAIHTCQRTVAALKAEGIDHILVLSHLGFEGDKELAKAVPGISLIVGGHSHTLMGDFASLGLPCAPWALKINGTPILHAGKYTEVIGLAAIEFNAEGEVTKLSGGNFLMLDDHVLVDGATAKQRSELIDTLKTHPNILWPTSHPEIEQVLTKDYTPQVVAMGRTILTQVPRELVHSRLPSKSLPHGSELAPWVSRAMYEESRRLDVHVDFALHNAGGVRQSLSRGELTLADVLGRVLPFELPLVTYAIEGQYLYQALESAINAATNNSVMGTGAGSFPYTYRLKYHYDGRRPLGERIVALLLANDAAHQRVWEPVEPKRQYIGVSSAYTASGKEGYQALGMSQWQTPLQGLSLPEAFIRFVSRDGTLHQEFEPQLHYISHL